MSERSEFRSRREERMENGVKNPLGSAAISQNPLAIDLPLGSDKIVIQYHLEILAE